MYEVFLNRSKFNDYLSHASTTDEQAPLFDVYTPKQGMGMQYDDEIDADCL